MRNLLPTLAVTCSIAVSTSPAVAQVSLRTAVQNMQLAAEICLRNYRVETDLPELFRRTGFTVTPGLDAGFFDFQAVGVSGTFSTDTVQGYCSIQSTKVPLAIAEDMGLRLAKRLFADKVELGNPELPVGSPVPLCDGLSIFATRQLIRVTYSAAGNSGECLNDGTSAIVINM